MAGQQLGEVATQVADQADVARRRRSTAIFMAGVIAGATAAYRGSRSPATLAVLEAIADGRDWVSLLDQSAVPALTRRHILSTANGVAIGTRIVRARRDAAVA